MKKALKHAMASTVPVLTARALKEAQRYGRLFKKHLEDVVREKREDG